MEVDMNDDLLDVDSYSGSEDEDVEDDERQHEKLLAAIGSMDGVKRLPSQRTETGVPVADHHGNTTSKVKIHDLIGSLTEKSHSNLKKQLNRINRKEKVLAPPLENTEQVKIQRSLAYEETNKEVSKWDNVVERNRKAEQIHFPLEQPDVRLQTTEQFVKKFQPRTSLEMEIAEMLNGSQCTLKSTHALTAAEERALKAMSIHEAKERRAELQKHRALLSYKESKARRQKKIKSKKFHKILKKEKLKLEKKSLEELQKSNPDEYMEKLKLVEKNYLKERHTLKHRGGSKTMKRKAIFGKYDEKTRQTIQDMIQKNKELMQKIKQNDSSDEDSEDEDLSYKKDSGIQDREITANENESANPWTNAKRVKRGQEAEEKNQESVDLIKDSNIDDIFSKSQMDSETRSETKLANGNSNTIVGNKGKKRTAKGKGKNEVAAKSAKRENNDELNQSRDNQSDEEARDKDEGIAPSLMRKQNYEDFDDSAKALPSEKIVDNFQKKEKPKVTNAVQINPHKVLTIDGKINHANDATVVDSESDTEDQQRQAIQQAFADDDVTSEFRKEKRNIADKESNKEADFTLPGWGDWGGKDIQVSKKKRKKFTIRAKASQARKDKDLSNVIISETKDTSIAKYMVNDLPFPFTKVDQFESSIRQPLGKQWNPESSYKQMIQPSVKVKMGSIINPINKKETFKNQQTGNKNKNESTGHKKNKRSK